MKLSAIIRRAASVYPDEYILRFFDEKREYAVSDPGGGDTLAEFIAWELYETFDPEASEEEQVRTAIAAMENAARELNLVIRALEGLATERRAA